MRKRKFGCFGAIVGILLIYLVFQITLNNDTTKTNVDSSNTHKTAEKVNTAENKETNKNKTEKPKSNTEAAKQTSVTSSKNTKDTSNDGRVPVTLTRTVDGDTIKVMYNGKEETVRYLLVDTPEEKKPGTCVQLYAVSAYNKNKQLLNSGKITLEFETNGDKRDKYGRLLAYVFVNGKSVQEELLKEGYARVAYIYNPPYKYLSKYQSDEKMAESKHINIWSQKGFVTDRGFNGCASKQTSSTTAKSTTSNSSTATHSSTSTSGNSNAFQNNPADDKESNLSCKGKIKGNANSKIYHMPGDAFYDRTKDNIVWFCTESQAQDAGYRHSKR